MRVMIGGIEYHEKKAVMKEIHACVVAKIIRNFISVRLNVNLLDAVLSCEDIVESAGGNSWPCHPCRRLLPLRRTAWFSCAANSEGEVARDLG
jgi:hypothetical protein